MTLTLLELSGDMVEWEEFLAMFGKKCLVLGLIGTCLKQKGSNIIKCLRFLMNDYMKTNIYTQFREKHSLSNTYSKTYRHSK